MLDFLSNLFIKKLERLALTGNLLLLLTLILNYCPQTLVYFSLYLLNPFSLFSVLIYNSQLSLIEGVQFIFGSNTTLTSQTYYRPRSNQEFSIIFAEPRDLLRFLNYQIDYSYSAALREDNPSII